MTNLAEIMEFFVIRDVTFNSFAVDSKDNITHCLCFYNDYIGEWQIYNKYSCRLDFKCTSRSDCLYCLNYFYGLPF